MTKQISTLVAVFTLALPFRAQAQQPTTLADTTRFVVLFSARDAGFLKVWREGP
jgi:hypothetical protein